MMLVQQSQLRLLRKRAGLTQQEVAKALNLSQVAISQWELGEREPEIKLWQVYVLLNLYDVPLRRLVEATGHNPDLLI